MSVKVTSHKNYLSFILEDDESSIDHGYDYVF